MVRKHFCCPTCHAFFRTRPKRCPLDGAVLEATDVDPMLGVVVGGRYQIEAVIGEGGIGRVYRARHTRISRKYAIKIPFGELAFDEAIRKRLSNEAEAASRVQHPNLVSVVDVGETAEGLFYLAMDLVQGSTLAEIVAGGALPAVRALTLTAQIADGLAHAHARELVHRDLKPDNVIVELDADGHEAARIVDFGIALVQDEAHRRLTAEGMVIGTPEYMAPEQLTGAPVDLRSDLFALGLVLYELVTGVTPFEGSSLEIATKNLTAELPPMATRGLVGAVDPRIEALVRWMTQKAPGKRPASADLVADEARRILATLPGGRAMTARRRPVTFTPLAADGGGLSAAGNSSPTSEAWSPIVVPIAGEASAAVVAGLAATAPPSPDNATIRTPVVPVPRLATRAPLGSDPPPVDTAVRTDTVDWPPLQPPAPAALPTYELSAHELMQVVPVWRRPAVIAGTVVGVLALVIAIAAAAC